MRTVNHKLMMAALSLLLSLSTAFAQQIERVEPLSWWTGMKMPLTLLVQGNQLAGSEVRILDAKGKNEVTGLRVKAIHAAESPNYLFLDMEVNEPGIYTIELKQTSGKKTKRMLWRYEIGERRAQPAANISYGTEDVIYLLMPDRFANGDLTNDETPNTTEKLHRDQAFGRHGGDIQGIIDHLDEIVALGATAVWPTPLLLDNEPHQSYHGYACADYYHIDPRFGTNELYQSMVAQAHDKGLKFIMDIVPNHCGGAHWWMQDLPFNDWIHQYPTFTRSNWQFSTAADMHAAKVDQVGMNSGWFDTSMPDMNLDNPFLLHYFQQWAIWWIEYANLDGLRVDTYPYNEKEPMSQWCKAVRNEYPGINIVGECWTRPASQVAYWQADNNNRDGFNSNLPCVMDFPLQEAMAAALSTDGEGWEQGLLKCYAVVADDYLYADPNNLLIFDGNHDTPRVRDILKDKSFERNKLVITLLATMRGIPQLTYGEEIGLISLLPEDVGNHGYLRVDYPGNWPGEQRELEVEQHRLYAYYAQLLNWRKNEPILHQGKLTHFLSRDNTYAYFRYTDEGAIFVFLNAAEAEREVPVSQYAEILDVYGYTGEDILLGGTVELREGLTVEPLSAMVIKLKK